VILLDTNVWSAQTRPNADRQILNWLDANADQFFLSTIVIAEIRAGIENPDAAHRRAELNRWLEDLETIYQDQVLSFDSRSAHHFGALIAKRKLLKQQTKLLDAALAAQALAFDLPIATRNTKDFQWTGVELINPWEP